MTAALPPLLLHYTIRIADAHAHLLEVELTIGARPADRSGSLGVTPTALPHPLVLFMPVWTPGSYLVREYARHVESVVALTAQGAVALRKIRKNAWLLGPSDTTAYPTVRYRIYANELTVRTNHVDAQHAYWNGASTYLLVEGASEIEAQVQVHMPEGWAIATALRSQPEPHETPHFFASSIDELLDCPFECGSMQPRLFWALGKEHQVWVWESHHTPNADFEKLVIDTQKIVETEAQLLAGKHHAPADALPYERYMFLWHVSPRGRGGLEHASSCTLLVPPVAFASRTGYLDVLSLIAHEFLHLWNIKRIRPAGLVPYRYENENYTQLLWWFEGGTSYFDWRVLRLAGLCSAREYVDHLAAELSRLADTPGALVHPLTDASFDAWIKAYRPNENSVNSTVSYYLKGEVVCALLDLEIRVQTDGTKGLDDVLQHLWWSYGQQGRPVPEDGMLAIFEESTGARLGPLFDAWIHCATRIDPASYLAKAGLMHERKPTPRGAKASLGVRLRKIAGRAVIESVLRGSCAMRAGLDHDDEILAIDGRRVEDGQLDVAIAPLCTSQEVRVVYARDGLLETCSVVLDPPRLTEGTLTLRNDASVKELDLLRGWLGEDAVTNLRGDRG